jgi:hypothetical protein
MQLLLFCIFLLLHPLEAEVSCTYLDYLFQTNSCCESLGNDVPCLSSIPKIEFEDTLATVDSRLDTIEKESVPYVPKIIKKNMTSLCHNDVPIIGGVNYDQYTDRQWFNRPDLYCHGNENRLVVIPQYHISHCFFTVESNGVRYTAKIPHNPDMTIQSYHQGTQSKSIIGFCHNAGAWTATALMKVSDINFIVQYHNGIVYRTEATNNHEVKFPCTSALEKVIGDNHNRVSSIPLCSDFQYLNQHDCELNVGAGAWDHSVPLQMMDQWHTIDLHKEPNLEHIYFTRESGSSYLRFCLTTPYDNPSTYINGGNYGFDNGQDAHMVDPNR